MDAKTCEAMQGIEGRDAKLSQVAEATVSASAGPGELEEDEGGKRKEMKEDKAANQKLSKSDDGGKAPAKKPVKT